MYVHILGLPRMVIMAFFFWGSPQKIGWPQVVIWFGHIAPGNHWLKRHLLPLFSRHPVFMDKTAMGATSLNSRRPVLDVLHGVALPWTTGLWFVGGKNWLIRWPGWLPWETTAPYCFTTKLTASFRNQSWHGKSNGIFTDEFPTQTSMPRGFPCHVWLAKGTSRHEKCVSRSPPLSHWTFRRNPQLSISSYQWVFILWKNPPSDPKIGFTENL